MDNIKSMRLQCSQLNRDSGLSLSNGKKPFVVINGHIMTRSESGKLGRSKKTTATAKASQSAANSSYTSATDSVNQLSAISSSSAHRSPSASSANQPKNV